MSHARQDVDRRPGEDVQGWGTMGRRRSCRNDALQLLSRVAGEIDAALPGGGTEQRVFRMDDV